MNLETAADIYACQKKVHLHVPCHIGSKKLAADLNIKLIKILVLLQFRMITIGHLKVLSSNYDDLFKVVKTLNHLRIRFGL